MHYGVREAAVAGQFYPDHPGELRDRLDQMLLAGEGPAPGLPVIGFVAPHAGYAYSGETAGMAFAAVAGRSFRRVIILAPSHGCAFNGVSAAPFQAYRTPLGELTVDAEAAERLAADSGLFCRLPEAHLDEHAVEVQLPFIQHCLPACPILPLVCGRLDLAAVRAAAVAIDGLWREDSLLVVSSDFTHYGDRFGYLPFPVQDAPKRLQELDEGAIQPIVAGDTEGFLRYVSRTGATICGRTPIAIMLAMSELAGRTVEMSLRHYTTSAAVVGDYRNSVSYAAIMVAGRLEEEG